jgi:membrane-bound ClpP family serine protease
MFIELFSGNERSIQRGSETIMCHLVLLIPIFGLAVFWIWPLSVALPVYLVIFTLSAMVYYALLKAMRQPVKTGLQGLIGEIGKVTDIKDHKGHIDVHGEIWEVESTSKLKKGDLAKVTGVNGLTLQVQKQSREVKQD